jgi:hypothetical protein
MTETITEQVQRAVDGAGNDLSFYGMTISKLTDVFVTVFSSVFAGLVSLFVKSPVQK